MAIIRRKKANEVGELVKPPIEKALDQLAQERHWSENDGPTWEELERILEAMR